MLSIRGSLQELELSICSGELPYWDDNQSLKFCRLHHDQSLPDIMVSNAKPITAGVEAILSVTRSLICFRSLKSPISSLNIDTGFLRFFSRLIIILKNMNINFFCATTESDEPRILKGGFWCIKTVIYANVFQDLIWSFALGYLKICRHVLVNDATSNTKDRAERWRIMLTIQWILILCLLSMTSVILGWSNMNTKSWGQ